MALDLYLTVTEHILFTAELTNLEVQKRENSADAYLLRNRLSLADKVLQRLPELDAAQIHSFETLLISKIKANPSTVESYLKVARYLQQDALLCIDNSDD